MLLTGASGLLGGYLLAALSLRDEVVPLSNAAPKLPGGRSVDLRDPAATRRLLDEVKPRVIVHAAALANVDACEVAPQMAWSLNVEATRNLVDWAAAQNPAVHFVFISTDQIYNAPGPSDESVPRPTNIYGLTKLWAEDLVGRLDAGVVLRVNFLGRKNGRPSLVGWLLKNLTEQIPITLFRDALFSPLYAADLSEVISRVVRMGLVGTFNCGAKDSGLSKADLGLRLAEELGLSTAAITVGSIDDVPLAARRPRDTRMISRRLADALGCELPDTDTTLARLVSDLRH